MKRTCLVIAVIVLAAAATRGADPGAQVVVVYNSRMPESKALAEYYALRRNVPTNQLYGFALPSTGEMSRGDYDDLLAKPLAARLSKDGLWKFGVEFVESTNGTSSLVRGVRESRVRYALLCYGVPFRITANPYIREKTDETARPELRRNDAAVDSELALLPWIQRQLPISGLARNPVLGCTNSALLHPTNGVLLVTRLDGPSAQIARGLVDKAIQAEADGLWGRAYFDLRNVDDPAYQTGDHWFRLTAEMCRRLGFETVVDEQPGTFRPEFPMSHIAIYGGWYDAKASGPFTRPAVEFMPGAFAYHLHSFSAQHLRNPGENWAGPLLAKGVTATMGAVDEPFLGGTPDMSLFVSRWIYYGMTFGEAAYAAQPCLSWQITVIGDPLYCPFTKPAQQRHDELERRGGKLIEWSHLRYVNLNQGRGVPPTAMALLLEQIPATKRSAVLTEKLADVYGLMGKPLSATETYQKALALEPSPQQRVRLRLALGAGLVELKRESEALDNYQNLLKENPDYPDKLGLYRKLLPLARALNRTAEVDLYESLIRQATNAPALPPG